MQISQINIKSENQTISLAISEFLVELDRCKFNNIKLLKVITGYGSHGKGGDIKRELLKVCNKLQNDGKIKNFTPCEKLTKEYLHGLCLSFPQLILDNEISGYNSGVILVELI